LAKDVLDLEKIKSGIDSLLNSEQSFYEAVDSYRQKTSELKKAMETKQEKYPAKVDEFKAATKPLVGSVNKGFEQVNNERKALEQLKSSVIKAIDQFRETGWIKDAMKISIQSKIVENPLVNLQELRQLVDENLKKRGMNIAKFQKKIKEFFENYVSDWNEIENLVTQFESGNVPNEIKIRVGLLTKAEKMIEESMNNVVEGLKILNESVREIFEIKNKCKSLFNNNCISDLSETKSSIDKLVKMGEKEARKIKDTLEDWSHKHRDLIESLGGEEAVGDLEKELLTNVEFMLNQILENDLYEIQTFKGNVDKITDMHMDKSQHIFKIVIGVIEEAELSFNTQTKTYSENAQSIDTLCREMTEKIGSIAKIYNKSVDPTSNLMGKLKSCISIGGIAHEELKSSIENAILTKKLFEDAISQEKGFNELKPIFEDLSKTEEDFHRALKTNEGHINDAATILKQLIETVGDISESIENIKLTLEEKGKKFDILFKRQNMILSGLTSLFFNIQNLSDDIEKIPNALIDGMQKVKSVLDEGFKSRESCLVNLKAPVANYMRTHGLMIQPIRLTIENILPIGTYPAKPHKKKKPPKVPKIKPVPEQPLEPEPEIETPPEEIMPEPQVKTEEVEPEFKVEPEEMQPIPEEPAELELEQPLEEAEPEEIIPEPEVKLEEPLEEAEPEPEPEVEKKEAVPEIEAVKSPLDRIREEMSIYETPELKVKSGKSLLEKIRKEVSESE